VHEKIADFLRSRKGHDTALVVAVVLLGACSFGLGRLSANQKALDPIVLRVPMAQMATVQAIQESRSEAVEAPSTALPTEQGQFVASKNGSVYHLPWCSGAQRIKEENKVWFATKGAAETAGYRPAANCKGL